MLGGGLIQFLVVKRRSSGDATSRCYCGTTISVRNSTFFCICISWLPRTGTRFSVILQSPRRRCKATVGTPVYHAPFTDVATFFSTFGCKSQHITAQRQHTAAKGHHKATRGQHIDAKGHHIATHSQHIDAQGQHILHTASI